MNDSSNIDNDRSSTDIRPAPVDELPFQRKHIGPTIIEEPDGALTLKIESETRSKLHSIAESISPKLTSLFSSLVTPTEPSQPQLSDQPPSEETEWGEIEAEEIQSEFGGFDDVMEQSTTIYGEPVKVNAGYTVSIPKTLRQEVGFEKCDRVKKIKQGDRVLFTLPSYQHDGEHLSFLKPVSSMSVSSELFDIGDTVERIPHDGHIEVRRSEQNN